MTYPTHTVDGPVKESNIALKLRLIYLPFLYIAIGFISIYTFLHWLLFIKWQVLTLKEDFLNIWLPFILVWVPLLVWLNPRLRLLKLKTEKGDLPTLYLLIACFAISVPTIIAQEHLVTATGKLTELNSITQINQFAKTKYYTVRNTFVGKEQPGIVTTAEVSGKYNRDLTFRMYLLYPLYENGADTIHTQVEAWYGIKYSKTISNNLPDERKTQEWENFYETTREDVQKRDLQQFVYLDRVPPSDDLKGYKEALPRSTALKAEDISILTPVNEPFAARSGNKFAWIFGSFGIGAVVWLIMILIPKLQPDAINKLRKGHLTNNNELKEFLSLFIPKEDYRVTPIIMDINIIIFLAMVFAGLGLMSFSASDLLHWGANYRPAVARGEWWRLLSSTFLHGGLMHLFMNMIGLAFVGVFLEPLLGTKRFILAYLLTGIIASITSIWWHSATVSVGASGAIFGMYGVFLALLLTKVFPPEMNRSFLISTSIFIGYNLLMGLAGDIDNAAHIGGLVSGFVIGFALYYLSGDLKEKEEFEFEHQEL